MTNSAVTKETSKRATAITSNSSYKKRLEGIVANAVLLDFWKDAYSKNVAGVSAGGKADTDTSAVPVPTPHTETEAINVLRRAGDPSKLKKKKDNPIVMPIRVLQSVRLLMPPSERGSLDSALENGKTTKLAFTPPYEPELTPERRKHLARMEKLRLKSQETKYIKITDNIKDQRQEDDRTTKSMTYAASIGINMIVAPISFGAFMYFFSGGVLNVLFPSSEEDNDRNSNPTGVDIKRLIVAVISGVIMMIIEMVLFVIRSHEFETHATKKKKKRGAQPFGSYSANSAMTYTDSSGSKTTTKTPLSKEDLVDKKTK